VKRLNPKTGVPFARWDTRDEDDLVFSCYGALLKRTGFQYESWVNKDKLKAQAKIEADRRRDYERRNPGKHRARNSKSNSERLKRKPRWIKDVFEEEIKELFKMAAELEKVFPWKMHVDHVVPKQGKLVSGLHVPWNLEIIPWITNIKKGNKFDVNAEQPPPLSEGTYRNGKVYTQFGPVPTTGTGEDDDDSYHHCGADARQDADHRAQEGSGDSVGRGGQEVEPLVTLTRLENHGEPEPEIVRLYFGSRYLFD
jgi:hypothetical protein